MGLKVQKQQGNDRHKIKTMKQNKLNLGCGNDYRKGWVNVDINKEVKADWHMDIEEGLPLFSDNSFSLVELDMCLEHTKNVAFVMDEVWRVCKPKGIVEIWVPHCGGVYALQHLGHKSYYGIGTLDVFKPTGAFTGERIGKARFNIIEEKLVYWSHNSANYRIFSVLLNPVDLLSNFGRTWQKCIEKFVPLRYDEIYYKLEAIK